MKVLINFHYFLHIIFLKTLSSTTTTALLTFSPSPTLLRHYHHHRSLLLYPASKTRTVLRMMSSTSSSSKKNNENKKKNNNNLLTVLSLPKKWQDFDSKKDDTYRIDPRCIFGEKDDNNKYKYKYNQYANNNNNNNNDDNDMKNDDDDDTSTPTPTPTPTPTSWSYDTIIDMNKYNSNDLIVSFDLDLYMEEKHKKIEQEEVEEEKKEKKEKKQIHHVHVHLNRDATEIADRAYKRLEISIMKKINSKSKSKKNKTKKKQQNINIGGRSSSSSLCTTRLFTSTTTTTTATKNETTTATACTNNTITNFNRRPIHIDESSTVELSRKIESLLLHYNSQEQEDYTTTTTTTATNTTTTSSPSVGLELSIQSLSDDGDAEADADAEKNGRSNNDSDGTHHKNNNMKLSPNSNSNNNNNNITNFQFNVISNPPVILATHIFESFQSKLFVGIPIVIQTTLLHATRAEVSWFVGKSKNNGSGHKYDDNIGTNKEEDKGEGEEEFELVLHDSHSFVPQSHHIGKTLYVAIRPVRDGYQYDHDGSSSSSSNKCFKEAFKFENLIETLPFMPIVSPLRDEFTAAKPSSSSSSSSSFSTIRMCTYNILADLYVSRQLDDGTTTYPHVKNYDHIKKNRRIPMIVGELLAYRSDIICLQEVDGSVYDTYLEPVFQTMGYDGYYSNKASSQREGCAMFWSRHMFDIDKAEVFNISDLFQSDIDNNDTDDSDDEKQNNATTNNNTVEDDNNLEKATNVDSVLSQTRWDSMKDINLLLESHNELRKVVMEKLGQVAQIATLKLKNPIKGQQPNFLIVANTHLFYHPLADHIRAMQVYVVLKKIDEVRRRCRRHSCSNNSSSSCLEEEEFPYPFMFCGDLNSDPLSGASQLIYTRSLASDQHDCWKYLYEYQWDWDGSDDEDAMITENDESKYRNYDTAVDTIERNNDTMRQDEILSVPTESKPSSTACTTGRSPPPSFIQLPGSFPILQSGCKEMPKFTNYAPGFVDTLDYIFGSQASKNEIFGFQPKKSAPMLSIKDVERFVAMVSKNEMIIMP
jgi:mRNA deadenylase 3'-5' endonuclease subunit Ccr4